MLAIAPKPNRKVAPADQRGAQRCRRHAVVFRRFNQHARITRVHRQPQHLPADVRQLLALRIDRTEQMQQLFCAFNGLWIWFIEPIELRGFANAQRMQQQHDFGQIT